MLENDNYLSKLYKNIFDNTSNSALCPLIGRKKEKNLMCFWSARKIDL